MTLTETAPDPARQQKAREYGKLLRRGLFLQFGISTALLLALLFSNASARLVSLLPLPSPWSASLYLLIMALGFGVIMAPLAYYHGFILPQRYSLSTQNLASWLRDRAKALALELLLALCLITIIYWLMENFPALWWLAAGMIMFLFSLLLTWLAPYFLIPLFFKLKPLEEGELKEKLLHLAKGTGVNIKDVLSMNLSSKATTANAMVSGWGKSKCIIFSDTLLQGYSCDEIEVTLAHELGHHCHHDIAKLMAIQTVAFLLAFYLADLALKAGVILFSFQGIIDVAALPWLVLVLAMVILMFQPILNWYNRHIELAADKVALELSKNPKAFINLMTKLTDQNLSEAEPSKWAKFLFYDHPTYNERVKLAYEYR